ncbi:glycosyltransferase family 4 protein [Acinetobacter pollinis]|uniref:Glycosyltransferase family 4 protein n=1 Tax=Acinetobacter pollinis TaxID=2605270 RepID=A0ABU6DSJ9_9GAMM|nr:glycosyltransferase family 1 protein [Acinetobacter pollinis]MEB5476803.1 glycosyltransferase family 4 protein [Acinetobacter pollinis]
MIYVNGRFLKQNITGVQRFAIELLYSLSKIRGDIVILVPNKEKILKLHNLENFKVIEVKGGDGIIWEQITLPRYLHSVGNPLLLNLCNTSPVFYKNKISTVHDITFLKYPQSYSWKFRAVYRIMIPMILRTSHKIITVSEFSKIDICNYYNIPRDSINVIYNAVSDQFYDKKLNQSEKKGYALAVSSPNLHKNFGPMIEAFQKANINLDLKIIGSMSGTFKSHNYEIKTKNINFVGRVNDEELINLYQYAEFFIFPSLYEGFGIPPLEAQACGCPVLSSNTASLPEVLGNSAHYFNPNSIDDMTNSIKEIYNNKDLKDHLIESGHINLKRFDWNISANKMNLIIQEVLGV